MAVRYPGRSTDEGGTPSSPAREPGARTGDATDDAMRDATRDVARPRRLARHTPARGIAPLAHDLDARRTDDAITCIVSPAAAALVREALAVALPGVPVTVVAREQAAREQAAGDQAAETAALVPAWTVLRRTQQRLAASDVAMRLQHALANPLTALLFEAQLLEMEPLPPALAEAVGRILTQCRRTIEVARRLDAAGSAPATPPGAPVAGEKR